MRVNIGGEVIRKHKWDNEWSEDEEIKKGNGNREGVIML